MTSASGGRTSDPPAVNFGRVLDANRARYEQMAHDFGRRNMPDAADACRRTAAIARHTAAVLRATGSHAVRIRLLSEVATDRASADELRAAAAAGRPDNLQRAIPFDVEGYRGEFNPRLAGAVSLPDNRTILWRDSTLYLGDEVRERNATALIVHEVNHTRNLRAPESGGTPSHVAAVRYEGEVRAYILQAMFNDPIPLANVNVRLRELIEQQYFTEANYPGLMRTLRSLESVYRQTEALDEAQAPREQRAALRDLRADYARYVHARTSPWTSFGGNLDNH